MAKAVDIDLGTTNSVVAGGKPTVWSSTLREYTALGGEVARVCRIFGGRADAHYVEAPLDDTRALFSAVRCCR